MPSKRRAPGFNPALERWHESKKDMALRREFAMRREALAQAIDYHAKCVVSRPETATPQPANIKATAQTFLTFLTPQPDVVQIKMPNVEPLRGECNAC